MKHYTIKVDKKLKKKLEPFWQELQTLEDQFYTQVQKLEARMAEATNIEHIEFFMSDGYYCGIGNSDRTMRLILAEEFDKLSK